MASQKLKLIREPEIREMDHTNSCREKGYYHRFMHSLRISSPSQITPRTQYHIGESDGDIAETTQNCQGGDSEA